MRHVEWITPLGLFVMQPYTKSTPGPKEKFKNVDNKTLNPFGTVNLNLPRGSSLIKPHTLRHSNGFPPNFVHSLDSSHMMLASLYLWAHGCTFASVHDCYWTHASKVPVMNQICRQQFVNLHSQPILENLSQHFVNSYVTLDSLPSDKDLALAKMLFKNIPQKGVLDLEVVKDSVYFFS